MNIRKFVDLIVNKILFIGVTIAITTDISSLHISLLCHASSKFSVVPMPLKNEKMKSLCLIKIQESSIILTETHYLIWLLSYSSFLMHLIYTEFMEIYKHRSNFLVFVFLTIHSSLWNIHISFHHIYLLNSTHLSRSISNSTSSMKCSVVPPTLK